MCPPQGLLSALQSLKAGFDIGRIGATAARAAGTAFKIGNTVGKVVAPVAKAAAPMAKIGSGLSTVAGLALSAKQLLSKPQDASSRASLALSQMNNSVDTTAKTATSLRANGSNDIKRTLGSLNKNNIRKNDTTGINTATSLLGLNLGG